MGTEPIEGYRNLSDFGTKIPHNETPRLKFKDYDRKSHSPFFGRLSICEKVCAFMDVYKNMKKKNIFRIETMKYLKNVAMD